MTPSEINKLQSDHEALKQKYFTLLEQTEKAEQTHKGVEEFLRRSLSRISLLADGMDVELDALLDRLRSAIRANQSSYSLTGLVERIMETAAIEQRKALQQSFGPGLLLGMIDKLELPASQQKRLKALRGQLEEKQALRNATQSAQELAQLINASIAAAPAKSDTKTDGGLLAKLFGKRDTDTHPSEGPSAPSVNTGKVLIKLFEMVELPPSQRSQLNTLRERFLEADKETELANLLPALAKLLTPGDLEGAAHSATASDDGHHSPEEILLQLLERLLLPENLKSEVDQIRKRLQGRLAENDIPTTIEAIADLIAKAQGLTREEKKELEDFLQQITQCLIELDSNIQGAENLRIEAHESHLEFNTTVQSHMQGIEDSVHAATELDQVKTVIQSRLSTIRQHLTNFRQTEEQRTHAMEHQLSTLKGELSTLENESSQLRTHLQRQQRLALFDPLTGLHNRRAYDEQLQNEYNRWKRYQTDLTLVVWDIDRFKNINDTFGHQAGDRVLKAAAKILQENLRDSDFIARFGGEEFVTLMPETALNHALIASEKLRKIIEESPFHHRDQSVPVTISCGLAQFRSGDTPEQVFERADKALYQAKQSGRNRCVTDEDSSSN